MYCFIHINNWLKVENLIKLTSKQKSIVWHIFLQSNKSCTILLSFLSFIIIFYFKLTILLCIIFIFKNDYLLSLYHIIHSNSLLISYIQFNISSLLPNTYLILNIPYFLFSAKLKKQKSILLYNAIRWQSPNSFYFIKNIFNWSNITYYLY